MSRESTAYSLYSLIPRQALNARSAATLREGALLKWNGGFADLHPWPEFGDAPLKVQLDTLARGGTTPLLARAKAVARLDGEARRAGRSLFAGLEVPRSHKLWLSAELPDFEQLRAQGFEHLKLKVSGDSDAEVARLIRLAERLNGADGSKSAAKVDAAAGTQPAGGRVHPATGFRIRLDFNGLASEDEFTKFFSRLPSSLLDALDFVEDPLDTWNSEVWTRIARRFDIRLALDSATVPARAAFEEGDALDVFVVKPARQDPKVWADLAMNSIRRMVVTANMDHPLGQLAAAFEAARLMETHPLLTEDAGLLTHEVYAPVAGFGLDVRDARLVPPAGTGLGFDESLQKLAWKELT